MKKLNDFESSTNSDIQNENSLTAVENMKILKIRQYHSGV